MKNAAAGWGVAVPAIGVWTQAAAERMTSMRAGRWQLEFDPKLGLVSFEVWVDGSFVYGSDDIVSHSGR